MSLTLGAVLPLLCNKDVKVIKVGTIIQISMLTLALKGIGMFPSNMGTLIFESVIMVNTYPGCINAERHYGWMPADMALVTGVLILLVKIRKIKKKYFDIIMSLFTHKFNKQGFIRTDSY